MGTILTKEMGLPIKKIICGVNENTEFPHFINTEKYVVSQSKNTPSSAMDVSHPSNLARLIEFYGGYMFDEKDPQTNNIIKQEIIDKMPNLETMKKDIYSIGITNPKHYETMKKVFYKYNIILDSHGAVGWDALEYYLENKHNQLSIIYETQNPENFQTLLKKQLESHQKSLIG